ncbi:MAG: VOC family protein [Akkermansiaceae bacterium]|nr:VOC family protein [Akkermansiaceae bacterium]NJR41351.1 VOC family protein [Akkermansiaceae bacterium]
MNNTRNPIGWFEIYVADMPRAKAFYETVFQTTLQPLASPASVGPELEMWQFPGDMMAPGCGGTICKMDGCAPGAGGTLIYFTCADCTVEESRVAAAGGHIVRPKFSIGDYGYIALLIDTEGNMIGLHSLV